MFVSRALVASAVVLGVSAAPAAANLPKFANQTIVAGKSIGGMKIHAKSGPATDAWGGTAGAKCTKSGCTYADGGSKAAAARCDFVDGKVLAIYLQLGFKGGDPVYSGPLLALKTDDGIGLGSSVADLKAAYPKVREQHHIFTIGHKVKTNFATDGKRIFSIVVSAY